MGFWGECVHLTGEGFKYTIKLALRCAW